MNRKKWSENIPFTVIPMAINIMSGIALWISDLSLTAKIIITMLIVLNYAAFFYGVLMADVCSPSKFVCFGFCAATNIEILIYTIVTSQWTVTFGVVSTLVLLIIWTMLAVFSFGKRKVMCSEFYCFG